MRFTTKTEYGLICLIYLARHHRTRALPVTIKELVREEHFSRTYIEKILQTLRAANILKAEHGNHGGYRLARDPGEITMKEVVEALEGQTFEIMCKERIRKSIDCSHFPHCNVRLLWEKTKASLDSLYSSMSLEMLSSTGHGGLRFADPQFHEI